ncbi:MAG: sporulation protein YqfD [Erysipelotrichaceae bacterium]|nr:sporulation protein YqfD [Erysipelotrichaceae bacterium]
MNDRGRFLFGLCRMSVTMPLNSLINQCVLSQIELFDVTQMDEDVYFYCALDQKKKLMKLFPDVKDHGTTGVLGFVLREIRKPFHWFLFVWVCIVYLVLSHTLIHIDYQSTNALLQKKIETYLEENQIHPGKIIWNESFENQLKQQLKKMFLHEIAWVEVERNASVLKIQFNHKESKEVQTFGSEPLISTKHAIVERFELLHGYKCVQKNQRVKPGDTLVQSYLVDSRGNMQSLYVSGKVYGITWYTVSSELIKGTEIEVLDFMRLLMDCRRQIEKEISEDEEVLKENILQVVSNEGKIKLTVHYTCLEDITKQ